MNGHVVHTDQNAMSDFFSPKVVNMVFNDPTTAHRLKDYCQKSACAENMEFLEKVSSDALSSRGDVLVNLEPTLQHEKNTGSSH